MVEADSIIPPLREEDPPSSDSEVDDAENGDYDAYAKGQFGSSVSLGTEARLCVSLSN